MARFHGKVGYGIAVEDPPGSGVHKDRLTEHSYFGDVVDSSRKLDVTEKITGDISVNKTISIVADAYANDHFMWIKYVEWAGVLWVVTSVEPKRPRLILSLGSVYNGPTP